VYSHQLTSIVVVVVVLAVGALGNFNSEPSVGFGQGFRNPTDSVDGQEVLNRKLDPGQLAPLTIITDRSVTPAVLQALNNEQLVASAVPVAKSRNGQLDRIDAPMTIDPFADEATDATPALRETVKQAGGGQLAIIGGQTAQTYDTNSTLARDAKVIVPTTLAVILLILIILLRALIAPLYLMLTVVLSFSFALGASRFIFTQIFGMDAIEPGLPTYSFIFLVALGIDYNIFLISRIREEAERRGTTQGILSGLERTGSVISGAGLILAGTFAALASIPLDTLFQIGFTVAFGVLIDTFVVRTILVPAIAFELGERSWWPGKLEATSS
jgi:RND superfamily putative drug exporter